MQLKVYRRLKKFDQEVAKIHKMLDRLPPFKGVTLDAQDVMTLTAEEVVPLTYEDDEVNDAD